MDKKSRKFTSKHLLIAFIIAIIWLIGSAFLFKSIIRTPSGGIDDIGDALLYAFAFRIVVFSVPALIVFITTMIWLYFNKKKLFKYILLAIPVGTILCVGGYYIYSNYIYKMIYTPEYAAKDSYNYYGMSSYEVWYEHWNINDESENTPCDRTCDFIKGLLYNLRDEMRGANIDESDNALMAQYIDAVIQERKKELPVNITSWKYIPRLSDIVSTPSYVSADKGDDFLLDNSSYNELEEKLNTPLCSEHQYPRYYDSAVAQFYSWSQAIIIFYDNKTMDIITF